MKIVMSSIFPDKCTLKWPFPADFHRSSGTNRTSMAEPFEATLAHNPRQFIIDQHIFPQSAIARFAVKGKVAVHKRGLPPILKSPKAPIFSAKRRWDQKTEEWLGLIDQDYAKLVAKFEYAEGTLDASDAKTLSRFYASWRSRWEFQQKANTSVKLVGLTGDTFPKDFEEQCEAQGVTFTRNADGECVVPSRMMYGAQLIRAIGYWESFVSGRTEWRCYHLESTASLLVPDVIFQTYVPFSPTKCFVGVSLTETETGKPLAERLNAVVKQAYKEFYFGRPE